VSRIVLSKFEKGDTMKEKVRTVLVISLLLNIILMGVSVWNINKKNEILRDAMGQYISNQHALLMSIDNALKHQDLQNPQERFAFISNLQQALRIMYSSTYLSGNSTNIGQHYYIPSELTDFEDEGRYQIWRLLAKAMEGEDITSGEFEDFVAYRNTLEQLTFRLKYNEVVTGKNPKEISRKLKEVGKEILK